MTWKKFKAIPPYFGGKQKLATQIFKHLPKGRYTFLDAFSGAGSISLFAKARGYKIHANDWGFIPEVMAKALLQSNQKINENEINQILIQEPEQTDKELSEFMDQYFLEKDKRILNKIRTYSKKVNKTKKFKIYYLMWKYISRIRPFGELHNRVILQQTREKEFYKFGELEKEFLKNTKKDRIQILKKIIKDHNQAIFYGDVDFTRKDIFKLLEEKDKWDIIYLDPPYSGTVSYEEQTKGLYWILTGQKPDFEKSVFNKKEGIEFLKKLAEACKGKCKILVLSFWTNELTGQEICDIFKDFNMQQINIDYRYSYNPQSKSGNKEFLGVGKC